MGFQDKIAAEGALELAGAEADLLIEAVFEQVEVKSQVFARFEKICPEKTVFVSNTSAAICMISGFMAPMSKMFLTVSCCLFL